jgi:hypothetical protein
MLLKSNFSTDISSFAGRNDFVQGQTMRRRQALANSALRNAVQSNQAVSHARLLNKPFFKAQQLYFSFGRRSFQHDLDSPIDLGLFILGLFTSSCRMWPCDGAQFDLGRRFALFDSSLDI